MCKGRSCSKTDKKCYKFNLAFTIICIHYVWHSQMRAWSIVTPSLFLTVRMSGVTCVISTSYLAPHRGNREVKNPLIREKNNFGLTAVYQIFEIDEYQAILSFQKHNSFSRFPPFLVQKQQQTLFNHRNTNLQYTSFQRPKQLKKLEPFEHSLSCLCTWYGWFCSEC